MKHIIFLLGMTWIGFLAQSQVVITSSDMPQPGDTARFSSTLILNGIDYSMTGEGVIWDFSGLSVMSQDVDTFVSVSSTPLAYQFIFNNQLLYPEHKATVARKNSQFDFIPGMDLSNTFQFYKTTTGAFAEVGTAVTLNGIPLPVAYDQFDVIYQLPLAYGLDDSATAFAEVNVPGLGYLSIERKRRNIVEGYGTLITPYGSFEALKVRSVIYEYDSIYVDSTQMGFALPRNITEYKWLSPDIPFPLLTVTEEGLVVQAEYVDSVRTSFAGISENSRERFPMNVYPNPTTGLVSVSGELPSRSNVKLDVFSMDGRLHVTRFFREQPRGKFTAEIDLRNEGLIPGSYLVKLSVNGVTGTRAVILK